MLFNSITFWIFFTAVYGCYLLLRFPGQNALLILASFVFYGAWDWRFLILLVLTTVVDYWGAYFLVRQTRSFARHALLTASIAVNLGILGFFKYFNFFADSFYRLAALLGWQPEPFLLHVILPVGVSFYTFQSISYMIEVWRGRMKPADNYFYYLAYVSFFPQLVAGPIERPGRLLPQLSAPRRVTWEAFSGGLELALWGLFKKAVIADNAAQLADLVFNGWQGMSGFATLTGVYAFAIQIYGDFSGYTDIARGLARMLGVDLMVNFRAPYLAVNPADFWRRWHISLSTWLRDYLYIPLGGSRCGRWLTLRNLFLTMLLGGLWHGAAWNFVLWGFYHGLILAAYRVYEDAGRAALQRVTAGLPPLFWRAFRVLLMFHLTCIGWVFFRAHSAGQAFGMLGKIAWALDLRPAAEILFYSPWTLGIGVLVAGAVMFYFLNNTPQGRHGAVGRLPLGLRLGLYTLLAAVFVFTGVTEARQFIYFQF